MGGATQGLEGAMRTVFQTESEGRVLAQRDVTHVVPSVRALSDAQVAQDLEYVAGVLAPLRGVTDGTLALLLDAARRVRAGQR